MRLGKIKNTYPVSDKTGGITRGKVCVLVDPSSVSIYFPGYQQFRQKDETPANPQFYNPILYTIYKERRHPNGQYYFYNSCQFVSSSSPLYEKAYFC